MKLVENGTPVEIAPAQSQCAILLPPVAGGRANYQILAILASNTDPIIGWAIQSHTGASLTGGQLVRVGNFLYWQCTNGTMVTLCTVSGPLSPVYTANNPNTGAFMSVWLDYTFQKLVPQGYAAACSIPGVRMIQSTMDAG
jgi:hypothetical protein